MTTLRAKDFESLAQMLDKNAGFARPAGQTTGYSLQEVGVAAPGGASATGATPASVANAGPAAAPALPSTVVDQQLHLPVPTHSREAAQQRAKAERATQPRGTEIWTQAELATIYKTTARVGGAAAGIVASATWAGASASMAPPEPAAGAIEPVYTVLYQQRVRAEDVFLGVDFTRDESSAASDGVVVKVEMPQLAALNSLTVHVAPFQLTVASPEYFLSAPLPRKVLAGVADAKWDREAKMLTVQLTGDTSVDNAQML